MSIAAAFEQHLQDYGSPESFTGPLDDLLTRQFTLAELLKDKLGTTIPFGEGDKIKIRIPELPGWETSEGEDGGVQMTFIGERPVASINNPVPLLPDIAMDVQGLYLKVTPQEIRVVVQMRVNFTAIIPLAMTI